MKAFALENGLDFYKLRGCSARLRSRERKAAGETDVRQKTQSGFVRVRLDRESLPTEEADDARLIVAMPGGVSLEITQDFDESLLVRAIRAVREATC